MTAFQHYRRFLGQGGRSRRPRMGAKVSWTYKHVAGHQDDVMEAERLHRWAKLNVETNAMAKRFMAIAKTLPRHYCITNKPWSLWHQDQKLVRVAQKIYKIVHDKEAINYWQEKEKIPKEAMDFVNWESINTAMKLVPHSSRWFITKHTVGMCGVGKWMWCWKKWEKDEYPRCGSSEDANHVWICAGSGATEVWDDQIKFLKAWLDKCQTDPYITAAIETGLRLWQ